MKDGLSHLSGEFGACMDVEVPVLNGVCIWGGVGTLAVSARGGGPGMYRLQRGSRNKIQNTPIDA